MSIQALPTHLSHTIEMRSLCTLLGNCNRNKVDQKALSYFENEVIPFWKHWPTRKILVVVNINHLEELAEYQEKTANYNYSLIYRIKRAAKIANMQSNLIRNNINFTSPDDVANVLLSLSDKVTCFDTYPASEETKDIQNPIDSFRSNQKRKRFELLKDYDTTQLRKKINENWMNQDPEPSHTSLPSEQ